MGPHQAASPRQALDPAANMPATPTSDPFACVQLFCKEQALQSCECLRQCHAHYCTASDVRPWEYTCTAFRALHGEHGRGQGACCGMCPAVARALLHHAR
jgi:hypothetical protein